MAEARAKARGSTVQLVLVGSKERWRVCGRAIEWEARTRYGGGGGAARGKRARRRREGRRQRKQAREQREQEAAHVSGARASRRGAGEVKVASRERRAFFSCRNIRLPSCSKFVGALPSMNSKFVGALPSMAGIGSKPVCFLFILLAQPADTARARDRWRSRTPNT